MSHQVYWEYILLSAIFYIITFIVIAILYYIFIFPTTVILYLFLFGPFGPLLAVVDLIIHSNSLSKSFCKHTLLTRFQADIFDLTLERKGCKDLIRNAKFVKIDNTKKIANWKTLNFWINDIPFSFLKFFTNIVKYLVLFIISLLPILGPLIVNVLLSPKTASGYINRYFLLNNNSTESKKRHLYSHIMNYICFGVMAGFMEFIPGSSMITLATNTVGGALWAERIIKKNK